MGPQMKEAAGARVLALVGEPTVGRGGEGPGKSWKKEEAAWALVPESQVALALVVPRCVLALIVPRWVSALAVEGSVEAGAEALKAV